MESISIFEIIKVGIGPSSSHTMGPWKAGMQFLDLLSERKLLEKCDRIEVHLYGSLALTGVGHGTDLAVLLALSGENYTTSDTRQLEHRFQKIRNEKQLKLNGIKNIEFNYDRDLIYHYGKFLPYHANGMEFIVFNGADKLLSQIYYSIGGGFISNGHQQSFKGKMKTSIYPCHDARSISMFCQELGHSVSELVFINEQSWRSSEEITENTNRLWNEMKACIFRGVHSDGYLPGKLGVRRRASEINRRLCDNTNFSTVEEWIRFIRASNPGFKDINTWISCFALAVNEENASFGRVVTAPTNGASGVIPAVMMYAHCFENIPEEDLTKFILVAGEIGTLFKKNATISAAAGGCQAEIGVSSAMAAAGLTEVLGGSPDQVLMAAEIAMEHHLGLTCDPIAGLVQIPCIERNSMGAIKAITASNLALQSDPKEAKVSLDQVIKTMWDTAQDMHSHYKETSEGGLAANVGVHVVEC